MLPASFAKWNAKLKFKIFYRNDGIADLAWNKVHESAKGESKA